VRQRADAGYKLARAERLGDVVIGAEFEADDTIDLVATLGQHQRRPVFSVDAARTRS
jgi:hypothetical protein